MAVTDTAIRGAKPGAKPFKLYDREGLFLLVNPGGSKLWRWLYRFDGKEKLMALGGYPILNLGNARELHLIARKALVAGIDPMAARKAETDAKQQAIQAAAYNHSKYLKQRTEMMQWWADYLDAQLAKGRKALAV